MKSATFGKFTTAFAAASLFAGSAASAAPAPAGTVDPLVALSLLGTSSSQAAVCAAGTASAAAAGAASVAQGNANCVLPVVDAAPVAPVTQVPPAYVPAPVATGGGIGVLPLLLGLAAVVGALALLLDGDDDDNEIGLPVSPA